MLALWEEGRGAAQPRRLYSEVSSNIFSPAAEKKERKKEKALPEALRALPCSPAVRAAEEADGRRRGLVARLRGTHQFSFHPSVSARACDALIGADMDCGDQLRLTA